ncbi:cuticular protein 16 [Halictus rubicundus]|uniref:cuticular protein 16 n=1 Tax=Halictus rubicundus TaxID=77578 RepID=UPI0040367C79
MESVGADGIKDAFSFQRILFGLFLGQSFATPIANVWLSPLGALTPLRQFHIQDGSGGYHYSFTGPHQAKSESSLNGITRGGYSYIDANGILQTVTYTADDQNGFRVSASNLPQPPKNDLQEVQDTPEVAAAKKSHFEELQKSRLREQPNYQSNILSYNILPPYYSFSHLRKDDEKNLAVREIATSNNPFLLSRAEAEKIEVPKPDPGLSKLSPSSASSLASSPSLIQRKPEELRGNSLQIEKLVSLDGIEKAAPLPASFAIPVSPPYRLLHSALHHTQDSLGQYDYTYAGDSSAKTESRSLDGTTRGAYSYIDPNGVLQQVHYVADQNGFRVLATNLPEAK